MINRLHKKCPFICLHQLICLGSRAKNSRIPDPEVKNAPDTGSRIRTVPQLNRYPAHLEDDDQERGQRFDDAKLESALFTESGKKKQYTIDEETMYKERTVFHDVTESQKYSFYHITLEL
jgi:hypothetical protein